MIKKLGVDGRGRKVCSGDDSESSADTKEDSEGESLWERAERLGQRSLGTAQEAPIADKARVTGGIRAPSRKRSSSASSGSSGSSEEEPLMARKRAKQEHSE